MNYRIYFDMDGVLADFVGGSLARHGKTLPRAETSWNFFEQVGLTAEQFWKPLHDHEFWAGLDRHADGMELFTSIALTFPVDRVAFLSSPGCPHSVDGKKAWLTRHLSKEWAKRAIFTERKELCAAPCKLLIDDHEPNIAAFTEHGGIGCLVPRPWNSRRGECDAHGNFDPAAIANEVKAAMVRQLRSKAAEQSAKLADLQERVAGLTT